MDKSYEKMLELNKVEGFDPAQYAYAFADLTTGRTWNRLPVSIQIIWFRLKHPDGKIALESIEADGEGFTASVKVYMDKKDDPEQYLSNASATRYPNADRPEISPKEWAQTAAIGIALRNAGFGLPFDVVAENIGELGPVTHTDLPKPVNTTQNPLPASAEKSETPIPAKTGAGQTAEIKAAEKTEEEKPMSLEAAYQIPCPIDKYSGKTLKEVLMIDATAINWLAKKATSETVRAAAQLICREAKSA